MVSALALLTCYDNNLPENARATTLLGAEVIVAPHVTGCTPSAMPGRGPVDPRSGRIASVTRPGFVRSSGGQRVFGWLMRWLPARAWENGVFYVFCNPIGVDFDTIKPGLSMILDVHGEILAECSALDDDLAIALLTAEAFEQASGRRYLAARRPELYGPIVEPHPEGLGPVTKPGWTLRVRTSHKRNEQSRSPQPPIGRGRGQ